MGRVRRGAPIGFFVFALAGSSILGVGLGCSIEEGTIEGYGPPGSNDAASGNTDGSTATQSDGGDAAVRDGAADHDGGSRSFDAACGQTLNGSTLTAFASTTTKVIDGLDDDWGCEAPFDLTSAIAAQKHSNSPDAGYDMSGACKFEWTPTKFYFFCNVTDPTPGDGTSANLTTNDAVEIYISGTPIASRSGNYGSFDHQYVVDWRGMKTEYVNGTQTVTAPSALTATVSTYTGGYKVEGSIDDSALLSGSSLAASMTLGFDFAIDNGIGQEEALVWTQGTHVGCGSCAASCCCGGDNGPGTVDFAYCDALAFGSMTLHP